MNQINGDNLIEQTELQDFLTPQLVTGKRELKS